MLECAKILVVEDERIVALDIQDQLEGLGYVVPVTVACADDAIRQAQRMVPDLILMDIRLKGDSDGIEAAQYIRDHLDIPIIFLTAYADESTIQRAKMTDSYGYLLKPFEERELRSAIEMALYKHEMERKLRQNQQWLSATLHSIGDAVIATDGQGLISFMNPVAQELTGWTESESLGQRLTGILRVVHPETNEPLTALMGDPLSGGSLAQPAQDGLLLTRDGQQTAVNGRAAPIRGPSGEICGLVVVFRDITEQVQARQALTQYASELEARNAELDAFSHTVAHDLKDPLSTVVGCAQMLEKHWPTMDDKNRVKFLGLVSGLGQQTCNIVDELLVLAGSRSSETHTEPVHMDSIVGRAKQRLVYKLSEAEAELVLPEQWPIVLGYGPWVEEVWVNYISNAIKYGGQKPRIELGSTVQPDGMVQFWVSDRGHGVSKEDQDRLFTPFTQLNKIRARGHGLGLSIVRRIVEKLGGEVGVQSIEGEGSTFYFTLRPVETEDRSDGQDSALGEGMADLQCDPVPEEGMIR